MERIETVDNIKGGLVFLVVFGHFIGRIYPFENSENIIRGVIYIFHMPAFILLSGMFTYIILNKANFKKILASIIAPIIVFELIFRVFFNQSSINTLIPYTPTYHLWFLISLLWWRLLTPYLLKAKFPIIISLGLLALVNLIVMHNNTMVFSVLRTFNFLPFFVVGAVYKDNILKIITNKNNRLVKIAVSIMFFILAGFIIYFFPRIPSQLFSWDSFYTIGFSYLEGLWRRLAIDVLSLLAIFAFILLAKNMNFLNKFGRNSLYIFLWHGAVIGLYSHIFYAEKLGNKYSFLLNKNNIISISIAFICALLVWLLFSQNFVKKVTDYMFSKVNRLLRLEV